MKKRRVGKELGSVYYGVNFDLSGGSEFDIGQLSLFKPKFLSSFVIL